MIVIDRAVIATDLVQNTHINLEYLFLDTIFLRKWIYIIRFEPYFSADALQFHASWSLKALWYSICSYFEITLNYLVVG